MILSEIKNFFKKQSVVSLTDLSLHFAVEPDAMRGMLDQWIRKGKVQKLEQEGKCSNCCGCNADYPEIYRWTESNNDKRT